MPASTWPLLCQQYIPGAPSEQNVRLGNQAITEFKDVLSVDPNNLSAIDASAPYFPDGRHSLRPQEIRGVQVLSSEAHRFETNDPEPYYWIGVIDWTLAFRATARRAPLQQDHVTKQSGIPTRCLPPCALITPPSSVPSSKRDHQPQEIHRGQADYDDAMAYLNLLYRRKADMVESARSAMPSRSRPTTSSTRSRRSSKGARAASAAVDRHEPLDDVYELFFQGVPSDPFRFKKSISPAGRARIRSVSQCRLHDRFAASLFTASSSPPRPRRSRRTNHCNGGRIRQLRAARTTYPGVALAVVRNGKIVKARLWNGQCELSVPTGRSPFSNRSVGKQFMRRLS